MEIDTYIALGSNLGNRELNILRAVGELGRLPESRVTALSSFYETSPVGSVVQDNFYNAAIRLTTRLEVHDLLAHLLRIEQDTFQRVRATFHGPRSMDLDLLFYGNHSYCEDHLVVPHPRLLERRFVLQPLFDIAADFVHPLTGKTIKDHLDMLESDETVFKI